MVSLSVVAGDDTFPFTIDAEMTGHFELAGTPDEKQFDMLKNVNCPAIMLPYFAFDFALFPCFSVYSVGKRF